VIANVRANVDKRAAAIMSFYRLEFGLIKPRSCRVELLNHIIGIMHEESDRDAANDMIVDAASQRRWVSMPPGQSDPSQGKILSANGCNADGASSEQVRERSSTRANFGIRRCFKPFKRKK
jgi:hypothetical protein